MVDLSRIVAKYKGEALLMDTNVLLLLLVGRFDRQRISLFKNTMMFTPEDYDLLVSMVVRFRRIASTPHILTELSNLLGQLGEPARRNYFGLLPSFLTIIDEEHVPHAAATAMPCFQRLGLTDAGISHLIRNRYPVVTGDLDLYLHLAYEGADVVNFNHVRDHGWC